MNGLVKICGITDASGMTAALDCGADLAGLVLRTGSSRFVNFETASRLAKMAKDRARVVAVIVDANDDFIETLLQKVDPDILQLHGREPPQRVAEIKARFKKPVFKALGIAQKSDLDAIKPYVSLCEKILLEAKTPEGLASGGLGRAFDWQLLAALPRHDNIILAGGLNPENVGEAIAITGVRAVDVSSGVETEPGIKDKDKVQNFIANARAAFAVLKVFA
jgi:phosphoribosylanthranilate isomerase